MISTPDGATNAPEIVGQFDQRWREDVGDDDVEASFDIRQRRRRDLNTICHAVRRRVGTRDGNRGRRDVDRSRSRCTEHARADGEHARSTTDIEHGRPVEQRPREGAHRQHRRRVVAEPERRPRFDPQHSRRPGSDRTAPTPDRSPDRRRHTPAVHGAPCVGDCFVDLDELPRPTADAASSMPIVSHVVAERRPQLDRAIDDALLDSDDTERPQHVGSELDVVGSRRDDEGSISRCVATRYGIVAARSTYEATPCSMSSRRARPSLMTRACRQRARPTGRSCRSGRQRSRPRSHRCARPHDAARSTRRR